MLVTEGRKFGLLWITVVRQPWKMERRIAEALSKKLCKNRKGPNLLYHYWEVRSGMRTSYQGTQVLSIYLEQRLLLHESYKAMLFLLENNQESVTLWLSVGNFPPFTLSSPSLPLGYQSLSIPRNRRVAVKDCIHWHLFVEVLKTFSIAYGSWIEISCISVVSETWMLRVMFTYRDFLVRLMIYF